ncbi:hypothetical protein [Crocosphaera sp.]|uniref:hypothetical protein n=1 Tax=Crocosphaera sp. TaxID=2729996 RepID=UPI0026058488|nr:hypothetical protein [Crocosphaera sp.]MDJ0583146.1 hypothetical protein [Crocosphaera sp.]
MISHPILFSLERGNYPLSIIEGFTLEYGEKKTAKKKTLLAFYDRKMQILEKQIGDGKKRATQYCSVNKIVC